jgi:hypothetical protein
VFIWLVGVVGAGAALLLTLLLAFIVVLETGVEPVVLLVVDIFKIIRNKQCSSRYSSY